MGLLSPELTAEIEAIAYRQSRAAVRDELAATLPRLLRRASLPPYLTRRQLADMTGWSISKVDYMRRTKQIPHVKRGRSVLFPTERVEEFLTDAMIPSKASAQGSRSETP